MSGDDCFPRKTIIGVENPQQFTRLGEEVAPVFIRYLKIRIKRTLNGEVVHSVRSPIRTDLL